MTWGMSRQLHGSSPVNGRCCFSAASNRCFLSRYRLSAPPTSLPCGRSRVGGNSTRNISNIGGGSRRCSHGDHLIKCYTNLGVGHHMTYGPQTYVDMHYGIPRNYAERRRSAASYQNECHHIVRVNEDLLKPFCVGVDPEIQRLRIEEREQMKHLNNQFACFIEQVRCLQQRNQVLATKWHLLQKHVAPLKRDLKPLFENCISSLGEQLDFLMSQQEQIEAERHKIRQRIEEFKSKYEEEIKRRVATENDFILLKKDVDSAFMNKVKLEAKARGMKGEIEFLRCVHNEEIALLQEQIQQAAVLMQMDNRQDLDVTSVLQNVESWYQSVAQRSKEEANVLYRSKYQELKKRRCQMYEDLKTCRCEIGKLSWMIQRLKSETEKTKKQVACLQSAICDAQQRGGCSLKDAQDKQDELYGALQKSKDDVARLLQSYQELLQDKMALDIEITTYKSLLEGEETRLFSGNHGNRVVFPNPSKGVGGCVRVPGYCSLSARLSSRSGKYSSGSRRKGTGHGDKDYYKTGCTARKISQSVDNLCSSGGEDSSPGGGCYSTKGCGNIFRDSQKHRASNCVAGGYGTAHVGRCVCDYSRASNSVDIYYPRHPSHCSMKMSAAPSFFTKNIQLQERQSPQSQNEETKYKIK